MAKNDSFKKKELNKKDYQGKDTAAKVVKGAAGAVGAAVILPKLFKGLIDLMKPLFQKHKS